MRCDLGGLTGMAPVLTRVPPANDNTWTASLDNPNPGEQRDSAKAGSFSKWN